MKDVLYPLRRIHSWLFRKKLQLIIWKKLNFPIGAKCFVIGTADHPNIGDSAIVIAEEEFILACYPNRIVKELTFSEYPKYRKYIDKKLCHHSSFFGIGGGNMGDQWFPEENLRRNFIIDRISNNPVIFPQTIYYTPTVDGQQKQQESIAIYNHPNMRIVAREQKSYEIMKSLYPKAKILLTPDIVLSSTMKDYGVVQQERTYILWVMRNDEERSMTEDMRLQLFNEIEKYDFPIKQTDMYSDCPVNKQNRLSCVQKKMQEFCGARLVITDRLHGMVFAAITGTPCIVFGNYNQKVKGTYDWISYLRYIQYVGNVEDAITLIPILLKMKDCHFDNSPLLSYFEKLKEFIVEK